MNKTPKTDIKGGSKKISLKKAVVLAMSAKQAEAVQHSERSLECMERIIQVVLILF